ncbi:head decoration protein [Puniceibacterium confluentis]|uniref:head decoration protein n=1 Tax=Puniceibacterium confluentis TaxID=1958944 RepID=UPI0011B5B2A4|nr:head decoration protein [Puniceibacterium confluentis]
MPTLTEGKTPGDFLLYEAPSQYSRDQVTIGTAADLVPGTVLGKITASGKFIRSVRTAVDGSETPVAILMQEAAAASADVTGAIVLARHAQVRRYGLTFDASWSTEAYRDTACAALLAAGIKSIAG